MWPYNMTRQDVEDFLLDNAREFIDYMMTACSYEVESALTDKELHKLIDRLNPDLRSIEKPA